MFRRLIITTAVLLVFGFAFDLGTTYLLFKQDAELMIENEINPYVVGRYNAQGPLGIFLISYDELVAFVIVIGLGSFVTGVFFFNEFRQEFDYFERVVIVMCVGFMMLATMKIGAGINNLICLFL